MLKYALNHWYVVGSQPELVKQSLDFPASQWTVKGRSLLLSGQNEKQLANGTTLTDSELCTWMYERLSFLIKSLCSTKYQTFTAVYTQLYNKETLLGQDCLHICSNPRAPKVNNSSIGNYNAPALHHFWQNTNNESIWNCTNANTLADVEFASEFTWDCTYVIRVGYKENSTHSPMTRR